MAWILEANYLHLLCAGAPPFWSVLGFLGILGCLGASWHHCYSLVTSWHPTWQPWQWEPVGWSHLPKKRQRNSLTLVSWLRRPLKAHCLWSETQLVLTWLNHQLDGILWDSKGFYGDIRWSFTLQASAKSLDTWLIAVAWQFQSRNLHGFYQISTASNVGNPEIIPTITINGWNKPSPSGLLFMTLAFPHYCIHTVNIPHDVGNLTTWSQDITSHILYCKDAVVTIVTLR